MKTLIVIGTGAFLLGWSVVRWLDRDNRAARSYQEKEAGLSE